MKQKKSNRNWTRFAALPLTTLALVGLSACATPSRTDYAAPELAVDPAWKVKPTGGQFAISGRWWEQFNDPQMTAFVQQVLDNNGNLATAAIKLRQARLSAQLASRQLFPDASASLSTGGSADIDDDFDVSASSSGSLSASWEVDLFGKLDASRDAAAWEAAATAKDYAATELSLAGTAALAWYQLAYANEQIAIAEDSLRYTERALQLVQVQYRAGAISRVPLRDAEQSVASQQASLTQLRQGREEALNAMAALVGSQTYAGTGPQTLLVNPLPAVDAGIPSDLLARRPDLSAAELRLRSTLATTDETIAGLYPSFSLTGALGTGSSNLIGFLSNPVASLGAAFNIPTLDPKRIKLQTDIARANYDAAVTEFKQTFYDALRDTSDALSARENYIEQREALQRSYDAAADAEQLYERQYRAGAIPLSDWLDAQERVRSARSSLLENRYNQISAQVALYQALGGDIVQNQPTPATQ